MLNEQMLLEPTLFGQKLLEQILLDCWGTFAVRTNAIITNVLRSIVVRTNVVRTKVAGAISYRHGGSKWGLILR